MVCVLVVFLIEVGKGKCEFNDVFKFLEDKNRNNVFFIVLFDGLYLEKIYLSLEELI